MIKISTIYLLNMSNLCRYAQFLQAQSPIAIQVTSYHNDKGVNGLQLLIMNTYRSLGPICSCKLNPIASVNWMNFLRDACWLAETLHNKSIAKQFYKCCTNQLLSEQYTVQIQSTIQLASQLLGRKILNKKILANLLQFAKFTPPKFCVVQQLIIYKGYTASRTSRLYSFHLSVSCCLIYPLPSISINPSVVQFHSLYIMLQFVVLKWLLEPCILTGYFSLQLLMVAMLQTV